MEPEPENQISDLYHRALERPPEERRAFLQEACNGDEALRQEVESLLRYELVSAGFLERPAMAALQIGTAQIGAYRILDRLGAGGMGEVYRAHDSKLGRDVAIKILPSHFLGDPERRVRFAREARMLATLNHPHIGAIYGLEESDGVTALVLELVEGPTLADRLGRGPLPVAEAIAIARQVAGALDEAHEKGIIHRDLKPANIVLQGASDGGFGEIRAKVLDFGLAKTLDLFANEPTGLDTAPAGGTADGRILGTPAYMSPEQARGLVVDKRTDVWAFGCVLFEMLSGRQPFDGDTLTDTLARILERDPEWEQLPADTPPHIRTVIERCLRKDPRKRLHDIADALIQIEGDGNRVELNGSGWASAQRADWSVAARTASIRERITWGVAALAIAAAATTVPVVVWRARHEPVPPATSASILLPDGIDQASFLALSRDGRQLAYVGQRRDRSASPIWVRSMGESDSRQLPGTTGFGQLPFWSPDGQKLGFFADGKLKWIALASGEVHEVCPAPDGRGGAWSPNGTILFAPAERTGLFRVSADGHQPERVTDTQSSELHSYPSFLSDGTHFVFTGVTKDGIVTFRLGSLDSPVVTELFRGTNTPKGQVYVARGMLFYTFNRSILAQAFDERRVRLSGNAIRIVEGIHSDFLGRWTFAVSEDNLVFRPAFVESATLTWLARNGDAGPTLWEPGRLSSVELSPDGAHALVERGDGTKPNLWVIDTARSVPQRLLDSYGSPVLWSRNSTRVLFTPPGGISHGNIYSMAAVDDGSPDMLVADKPDVTKIPVGWSETGSLLYAALGSKSTRFAFDLWEQPESGPAQVVIPAMGTNLVDVAVEPAGRFMAYAVDGTLYVRAVRKGTRVPVASGGAQHPRWRADGRELYYLSGGHVMAAEMSGSDPVPVGSPRQLFEFKGSQFSPARDGRFLAAVPTSTEPSAVNVVFNWASLLPK
jgi:serine/threonine protein kinase